MKITIGSDHAGFIYKSKIIDLIENELGHRVLDVGPFNQNNADYPDYAHLVAEELSCGADFGILICGSGNGINMAANKHKHVRSAVCWNKEITKLARNHNDANIIALPARFIKLNEAKELVRLFLSEKFEKGRHLIRVNKIIKQKNENH